MNWILIILAVLAIFLVLKFKEIRHKLGFVVVLLFLLFLSLSFWNVYNTHNIDISTFNGFVDAGKAYFSWLGGVIGNTKAVTTYAIKQDWGSQEVTDNLKNVSDQITNSTGK
jgi:hypothetical protein